MTMTFDESYPTLDKEMAEKVVYHANLEVETQVVQWANKMQQQHNDNQQTRTIDMNFTNVPTVSHNDITLGSLIGKGSFANVYAINSIKKIEQQIPHCDEDNDARINNNKNNNKSIITAETCVVKVLRPNLFNRPGLFATCVADITIEAAFLSSFQHPNIVHLKAIANTGGINGFLSGRHDAFFMVMERLECTLASKLDLEWAPSLLLDQSTKRQSKKISSIPLYEQRLNVAVQLSSAVAYLHSKHNIIHRDLKPENIGLDSQGNVKIFDFDVARILPNANHSNKFKLTQKVGSRRYMAPENGLGRRYNISADVYSTSLIIYYLLSLNEPFHNYKPEEHFDKVFLAGERPNLSKQTWPKSIKNMLQCAWSKDIMERPTMGQIHNELKEEYDVFTKNIVFKQKNKNNKGLSKFVFWASKSNNKNNNIKIIHQQQQRKEKPIMMVSEKTKNEEFCDSTLPSSKDGCSAEIF